MKINSYLYFTGQCKAAFEFYEKCFNGKIAFIMTHGESPMADKLPKEQLDTILHVRLEVGDQAIMGSDTPQEHYDTPQGFRVSLGIPEPAEAERVFKALSDDGHISMPLEETFWARRFGMLEDKFGIPWMINCEKPF